VKKKIRRFRAANKDEEPLSENQIDFLLTAPLFFLRKTLMLLPRKAINEVRKLFNFKLKLPQ